METTRSVEFFRKRKFLLMVPLLMLPFLMLAFWALGGGKKVISPSEQTENAKGFNAELPAAHFKNEIQQDKLSLYEKARMDSLQLKNSFFSSALGQMGFRNAKGHGDSLVLHAQLSSKDGGTDVYMDPNEERINKKLTQLSQVLQREPEIPVVKKSERVLSSYEKDHKESLGNDVEKLETMMKNMSDHSSVDPEMQQLNNMMEKILDIQHPDRVREEIRSKSLLKKRQVFAVETLDPDAISLMNDIGPGVITDSLDGTLPPSIEQNAFYGLEEMNDSKSHSGNVIEAVIHDTQLLTAGATVKIRLQKEVFVNGHLIPKGQLIYGTSSIQGDRLHITIESLLYQDSILPVALSAYDMDGMEGLYIPGSINREAAKKGTDDIVQGLQLMSTDVSLGAQAAGASIQAAKGLFSKKSKLLKVTVKAGYQLFLRDKNSNL